MMPKKLSPAQQRVVRVLGGYTKPQSAYSLRCSLATLEALVRRGKVRCVNAGALGTMWYPRTELKWELTLEARDDA